MPEHSPSDDISERRERIYSELVRANRGALGIFVAVVLLALATVFAAHNAQRHAADAIAAKATAQQELWRAQLAQARATRQSVAMGRRVEAWKAVTNAASFKRSLELRNEAIAALATPDIRQLPLTRDFVPFQQAVQFDASGERYLEASSNGVVTLRRAADNQILWTLPRAESTNWYGGALISRGGRWMFTMMNDGTLVIWDILKGAIYKKIPAGKVWSYSVSGDDRFVCISTADRVARLYSMPDWVETARLEGIGQEDDLTLNDDGSRVAIRAMSKAVVTLARWDRPTNRVILPHPTTVFALDWHPGAALIATAAQDQRIRIFNADTGQELRSLAGHHSQPIQLAWVAGRPWLLSMSWDGTSRLWDTVSGEELVRVPRYGDAVSLNPETLRFGWCYQNNSVLELFQIEPSAVLRTLPDIVEPAESRPAGCALSMDEHLIATVSPDGIRVRSVADGALLKMYPRSDTHDPIYTRDGTLWFGLGTKLFRVPSTNGSPEAVPGIVGEKFRVSDNGSVVAALRGSEINVLTPNCAVSWDTRQEQVETIALSGDGRWIATGTRTHIGMRVWDARTGKLQWQKDLRQGAGVWFTPNGQALFTAASEGCALWESESGKLLWEKPRAVDSVMGIRNAISPDGRLIAVAKTWTEAMLLDPQTGAELASLKSPNPRYIDSLNFSGAGRYLAVSYEDRSIQLWDLGALRGQLAAVGLDWEPHPTESTKITEPPNGPRGFLALAAIGVGAAIAFGVGIFYRHRRLLRGYLEIEALVIQRQQQLRGVETELARGQKMTALGTLAAGVAHDFNNLLSVIRMANTGIARTTRRSPEISEDLQDIEAAVVDGKRIVQSMLGYTRDGLGPVETFAVAALLEESVRLLSRQFLSGLQLQLDVEPGLPEVLGYPGRLKQMLLNLVVNASEAMNGKGRLCITALAQSNVAEGIILRPSDADRYVIISLRDNGPGIDPQTKSRIFEPFFTTKNAAATRGTGLGLSLVYTMAEQDGLGLDCQSAIGQGATFTIYFPVHANTGSRSPSASAPP